MSHERVRGVPLLVLMNKSDILTEMDAEHPASGSTPEPALEKETQEEKGADGLGRPDAQSPSKGSVVAHGWTEQDDEQYHEFKAYGWEDSSGAAASSAAEVQGGSEGSTRHQESQRLREALQRRCEPVHRADMALLSISALKALNLERCR